MLPGFAFPQPLFTSPRQNTVLSAKRQKGHQSKGPGDPHRDGQAVTRLAIKKERSARANRSGWGLGFYLVVGYYYFLVQKPNPYPRLVHVKPGLWMPEHREAEGCGSQADRQQPGGCQGWIHRLRSRGASGRQPEHCCSSGHAAWCRRSTSRRSCAITLPSSREPAPG